MKTILSFITISLIFQFQAKSQTVDIMTYNIRLNMTSDGENAWPVRKDKVAGLIAFHEPDIFGVQEALPEQMFYLDSILAAYGFVGEGRDGGNQGEYSAIFYNTRLFEVIKGSTFWLSETPTEVSLGWDAAYRRVCSYALFKEISSDRQFWVFNLHLDHVGQLARNLGVKVVLETIQQLNTENLPVILIGDFNATEMDEPILLVSTMLSSTSELSTLKYGPKGTFNGFDFHQPAKDCIDYIFVSKTGFKVAKYGVITDSFNCHYPSDHFPVWASLSWE
ncbi:MAG TPA: endonuclease/exonuclease/phosphatase [Marinilabiliales bacterium]|jgi:endonuclease/exonuclease/phosphatase family metal-dependent hydrolase|nr:MAG: hypothetical protein A2W95_04125 [Bacteroidetes bacterium GWA2_40_14]OFX58489.1 MAG: hypothetical protein A2W84_08640 [Bacteroidetes bacterium GWC2_40_13]OFX74111.1 MAG: hypothetical protein A2W96_12450 [Bacteroidetes bacterium GWD2_40_43]OFX93055.1 MAG: hypothetical protein A2W97_05625 [Bacteroidetes bacterium GWE2_40_63]OFY21425.1 MAG: hypothetical protein A2W88_09625 [Bacteroidetes bacterium GWF2_40_13]OFZ27419.1 MAG: hypothetical protein A2437_14100 [Bacteroidetes bacterium RIFOXYC